MSNTLKYIAVQRIHRNIIDSENNKSFAFKKYNNSSVNPIMKPHNKPETTMTVRKRLADL